MARLLLAGGSLLALTGAALIPPVLLARLERGEYTVTAIGTIAVSCFMISCGLMAVVAGVCRRHDSGMPGGVRAVVAANILFLAFFALELSDRLVRQDGRLFYWSSFLSLPALWLFCGLVTARRWAWWTSRGAAALGVMWFLGFVVVIPFAHMETEGVPVPWYGRIYMAGVSLVFAGVLAGAFWSLGRTETRTYFGRSDAPGPSADGGASKP